MSNFFKKRIDTLLAELKHYQQLIDNADNEELAKNAQALGEETLAQIWACRKEQEKQKPKGLYFEISETSDNPAI